MKDLLSSRGFWVLISTVLTTVAVQFPETQKWVQLALPIVAALAAFFGVALQRALNNKPSSYVDSLRETEAIALLKAHYKNRCDAD